MKRIRGNFLKPPAGEEWIERFRRREFWIGMRRRYPQKFYARLVRSYVGWWLYFRISRIWHCAGLLIDPLSSGGFYSHLTCFLRNWLICGVYWRIKHKIWKLFHKKEWQRQLDWTAAMWQATDEGFTDKLEPPDWLPAERFHGVVLGERYFRRVAEIMKEKDSQ